MLDQTTAHMISLVDFMTGDDRTAKVWIQQENECTVKLWVVPEFQIRSSFGVVLQMARVRKPGGKIRELHICISHNIAVGYNSSIRGDDSLCGNRNSHDFPGIIMIRLNKQLYICSQSGIVGIAVLIWKLDCFCCNCISIQIHGYDMKHIF